MTHKEICLENREFILNEYIENKRSLTWIARQLKVDRKKVKEFLIDNDIKIVKQPVSVETRKSLSKPRPIELSYKNCINHITYPGFDEKYIRSFNDIKKFALLRSMMIHHLPQEFYTEQWLKGFMNKFYYDNKFNKYYNDWLNIENRAEYAKPSIDHIIPLSKGGTWNLDNLRIIPWCVNRAKYNFMPDEWEEIKNKYFK